MKFRLRPCLRYAVVPLIVACAGCGSVPQHKEALSKEQILNEPDVKGHPPTVFAKNLDEVRLAGVRALTFVGCEVKAQEPLFVAGHRPHKMGLLVGSGGETVKIFLYPQSDAETQVWVDTDKSFVGLAGQQDWNKQVLEEMTKLLATSPAEK